MGAQLGRARARLGDGGAGPQRCLGGVGEGSGLPGEEYLFEAGEEPGEDGHDDGVQGVRQSPPVITGLGDGAQASKLVGQGGGCLHGEIYN